MEPNAFVAEVYRRMRLRAAETPFQLPADSRVEEVMREYKHFLPQDKTAPILDLGFGQGWFLLACRRLGYTEVHGADFSVEPKAALRSHGAILHNIQTDIGDFLGSQPERYAFIHMAHVIEHIPKHSLLWVVDGLYYALKPTGTLLLRTPNMEGPAANSSYYVTLGHEYGFAGSNLKSLLEICGFEDVEFHSTLAPSSLKQKVGGLLRSVFLLESRVRHRLFGVNVGNQFDSELVVTAQRGGFSPLFDPKYR